MSSTEAYQLGLCDALTGVWPLTDVLYAAGELEACESYVQGWQTGVHLDCDSELPILQGEVIENV